MSSSLGELCERAEELGIADELAEVVGAYVDAAERAARSCEAFRWGDSCEGTQLVYLPPVPPVLVAIGPVVEITYEATKGDGISSARIAAANVAEAPAGFKPAWSLGDGGVDDFVTLIESGGEKPLPPQFAGPSFARRPTN